MDKVRLCRLEDLELHGSKGVIVAIDGEEREIFVVRNKVGIFAYENSCPHTGTPLDWMPDQFLDAEREYIICSTHGALFGIEDGVCVAGPCINQKLLQLSVVVSDGEVYLLS